MTTKLTGLTYHQAQEIAHAIDTRGTVGSTVAVFDMDPQQALLTMELHKQRIADTATRDRRGRLNATSSVIRKLRALIND